MTFLLCNPGAGTSNELDVQNEWEENTHTLHCFTADLTVIDSSQRVWASTFYSLPSVLSTCRWSVPYLASNVGGGDCGAVVI